MLILSMLLSRLTISNFRQYQHLELSFKDGITGIVGRNGSGKSTILEAVLWCLFGNRAARTGKEGIKRQTASPADSCWVALEFVLGGITYCLKRSLIGKSNRSEAHLSQQGRLDAVSTREVDDYVVRLIGLNLKGFLSSFFARQKELNALSEARPADRKDHLAKMLGVGRLDNAIQLLKEEIKNTRQKIEILGTLQIDPRAVTEELSQKKTEIKTLEKSKTALNETIKSLETVIADRQKTVESLRQKEQENNRLEKEYSVLMARREATAAESDRLSSEIKDLEEVISKMAPLKEGIKGIDGIEKEVADLRQARTSADEKKRLENEIDSLEKSEKDHHQRALAASKTITDLEQKLEGKSRLLNEIMAIEGAIEKMLKEYQELSGEIRVAQDKLATMEKQKSEINELGPEASCKLCLRPFAGELDEIEGHFDQEILSLRQQLKPMTAHLAEITESGKTFRQQLKSKNEQKEQLNKIEQALASARADLKGLTEAQEKASARFEETRKRLKEIGETRFDPAKLTRKETELRQQQKQKEEYIRLSERAGRKPEIEKDLKKAGDSLTEIAAKIKANTAQKTEIGFEAETFKRAINDLEKSREEAGAARIEFEKTDGRLRLLTAEAETKAQKLAEYEKSKAEISVLRESLTYLEKLSILFSEFRIYLIGRIRPSLSKRTSQLFREMTEGRYQEIELDEDYSLRVYDRGEPFGIDRFSGGEVDLANLCFRLAISVEMAATAGIEQSFIILDEIFGSQDSDRQRMIFEGLGRLKNRFRQIIIISHIDDVKEMAENIITVEIDRTGLSRAVAVEN